MCRVEDSGKAVDGFFVLGASERLFKASIIAMLFLLLKCLRGLATLTILLSPCLQRYIISLKNKVEYSISSNCLLIRILMFL